MTESTNTSAAIQLIKWGWHVTEIGRGLDGLIDNSNIKFLKKHCKDYHEREPEEVNIDSKYFVKSIKIEQEDEPHHLIDPSLLEALRSGKTIDAKIGDDKVQIEKNGNITRQGKVITKKQVGGNVYEEIQNYLFQLEIKSKDPSFTFPYEIVYPKGLDPCAGAGAPGAGAPSSYPYQGVTR